MSDLSRVKLENRRRQQWGVWEVVIWTIITGLGAFLMWLLYELVVAILSLYAIWGALR